MQAQPPAYPLSIELNAPLEVARWRPLVHWLLVIPQLLVSQALKALRSILRLIAFFTVLFTKQIPESLFNVIVMTMRYQWRVMTYWGFMREAYPPFEFDPSAQDPGTDPASLSIEYPSELARFMPLIKWLLAIPHYFLLVFLAIGCIFAGIGAFFAVLFTGRYPEGIRRYVVGVARWSYRVGAYAGFLTDEYPPFSLH